MKKLCKDCELHEVDTRGAKPRARCPECHRGYSKLRARRLRTKAKEDDVVDNPNRCNVCLLEKRESEFRTSLPNGKGRRNKICDTCLTRIYTNRGSMSDDMDDQFWRRRAYSCNSAYRQLVARQSAVPISSIKLAALDWTCKPQDLVKLFTDTGGVCKYCSVGITAVNLAVDHVDPKSRGGAHHVDNLAITCTDCNHLKHTKNHSEFTEFLTDYVNRFQALEVTDKEP